ncbi:uncharacterized protein LOC117111384, partial [Anneissia japonica]|uniref:uncharacterized protein LOC117111384 n=1 Tax=Anneissia japonica TaxID=1529436 RepID=UPI0014255459
MAAGKFKSLECANSIVSIINVGRKFLDDRREHAIQVFTDDDYISPVSLKELSARFSAYDKDNYKNIQNNCTSVLGATCILECDMEGNCRVVEGATCDFIKASNNKAKCVLQCEKQGSCRVADGAICDFIENNNEETSDNNEHRRTKRDDSAGKGNHQEMRSAIFELSVRCTNVLRCGRKDSKPVKPPKKTTSVIACCLQCLHGYPPCVSISFNRKTNKCTLFQYLGLPNKVKNEKMIYYSIKPYFTDCSQIPKGLPRSKSGIYALTTGKETFLAMCEIDDNEGWTVLQRRQNSTFNFNRTWAEYQRGFGHLRGDFWFGLDFMHKLTSGGHFHLRMKVTTKSGDVFSATYASFRILQESKHYELRLGKIINDDGGPVISNEIKTSFSTYDRDNTEHKSNCALKDGGGWWFRTCSYSCFINGLYSSSFKCDINDEMQQLSSSVLMIKPVLISSLYWKMIFIIHHHYHHSHQSLIL